MNVLIVHAHEEPRSFNGAMLEVARSHFEGAGHRVVVSDLYRMGFKAVADASDFAERVNPHYLKRQQEEVAALGSGGLAPDILEEQRKLEESDLLVLQFPLWWASMPAILKGWVDRVMTNGFAYGAFGAYDKGGLAGRRAMLAITTGGGRESFSERGISGHIDQVLFPIHHGILYFCGFEVMPPYVAWEPAHLEAEERVRLLDGYRAHLEALETAQPIPFHPLDHYDEQGQLRPEHAA